MLVVGDKEMEAGQVALRLRNGDNPGPIALEEFIQKALEETEQKI
jgi:threonyl-tRNA synthetase